MVPEEAERHPVDADERDARVILSAQSIEQTHTTAYPGRQ
jgi:hypothetical protein